MIAIHNKATHVNLEATDRWDDEKYGACRQLPVAVGDGFLASYWKTSLRERLMILFGRPIRLVVCSMQHPPVGMDVDRI